MRVVEPVGRITHYYNKIGVAIVHLAQPLRVGERIQVDDHRYSFVQEVTSIEQDHQRIRKAEEGMLVGVRVAQPVHEGAVVFRV